MNLAIIAQGFHGGSSSVLVYADAPDGTLIRVFDDETKVEIGSGSLVGGKIEITLTPSLFTGQRIIAYVGEFGEKTFGSTIVLESETEATGWKVADTVNGIPYAEYLEAGGSMVAELYTPDECRNVVIDRNTTSKALSIPVTFNLRITESQGGTVQVVVENVAGSIGGFFVRFDSDAFGAETTKTYSANGAYQVKVWSADELEADAVVKSYSLTMPSAVVEFKPNVIDLTTQMDFGYTGEAGLRVIILTCHCLVPVQFKIDGLFDWEDGIWTSGLSMRANIKTIAAGEYTIRARNKAVPTEAISRQIKLTGY